MYVNDMVLLSSSREIRFNHKKSAIMICRGQSMKKNNLHFTLNGEVVNEVDSVRYLGYVINSMTRTLCVKDNKYMPVSMPY